MGIISRLFHRSDGLADNKFNLFFMDMAENIHIHYRDLRIELSVPEFVEFADLCQVYLPQVRKEIEAGYRDGVHPNTNQVNTWKAFSNKTPLQHAIAYNPNRISLEENLDGYHIHIRNYKILLDKDSFMNFARAAKEILDATARPVDLTETLNLIAVNELEHQIDSTGRDGDRDYAVVTVAKPYLRKTQQLLEGLKYRKSEPTPDAVVYEKDTARVLLRTGPVSNLPIPGAVGSGMVPFADFIRSNGEQLTPRVLNLLKLQILDFFCYARKKDLAAVVELDYRKLIYDTASGKVIFPTRSRPAPTDIDREYKRLATFFAEKRLFFVKPAKVPYAESESERLQSAFQDFLDKRLATLPCVAKVYLLNPGTKKRAGRYEVPFVHSEWVKLGSDFDLLIEIDERHPLPAEWEFKFFWKLAGSDYYHLGDVDFPIPSPHIEAFPNIDFHHHLVESYLFFPSRSDKVAKDAYLKKFNASLLYRKNETVRDFVAERYKINPKSAEKISAAGFNEVFKISTAKGDYAAKIMIGQDFTTAVKGQSGRHLEYEADLLQMLAKRELPVLAPLAGRDGRLVQPFDDRHCLLFPFVRSDREGVSSAVNAEAAARTLATVHAKQSAPDAPIDTYRFEEAADYELEQFASLFRKFASDDRRRAEMESLIDDIKKASGRILETKELPRVHAHGDVCPRNFFYVDGKAILYDFQMAHYGPRIGDLAEGALEFAWHGNILDERAIDAFVAAYESENRLNDTERALLPTMLFLQAAFKLALFFRLEVVYGYKVAIERVTGYLNYALTHRP